MKAKLKPSGQPGAKIPYGMDALSKRRACQMQAWSLFHLQEVWRAGGRRGMPGLRRKCERHDKGAEFLAGWREGWPACQLRW
jgi:hypothetical protein